MLLAAGERRASEDALQSVQAFLASDHAVQEKVDRLVGFLANDLSNTSGEEPADTGGDIFANEAQKKKNEQEALLKKLVGGGGGASALAADNDNTESRGGLYHSKRVVLYSGDSDDLVADGLANKQAEQEALLKTLTGGGASTLATESTEAQGAQSPQVAMLSYGDLVADGLATKQAEQKLARS